MGDIGLVQRGHPTIGGILTGGVTREHVKLSIGTKINDLGLGCPER